MSSFTFVLLALFLVLCHCSSAETCLSTQEKDQLTASFLHRAARTSLSATSIRCFEEYASEFQPIRRILGDKAMICYDRDGFGAHMVHAVPKCIHAIGEGHKFGESLPISQEQGDNVEGVIERMTESLESEEAVRSYKGKYRKNKRKKRQNKYICKKSQKKKSKFCTCSSGCHYCCVNYPLRAVGLCFKLYCKGKGCCAV